MDGAEEGWESAAAMATRVSATRHICLKVIFTSRAAAVTQHTQLALAPSHFTTLNTFFFNTSKILSDEEVLVLQLEAPLFNLNKKQYLSHRQFENEVRHFKEKPGNEASQPKVKGEDRTHGHNAFSATNTALLYCPTETYLDTGFIFEVSRIPAVQISVF